MITTEQQQQRQLLGKKIQRALGSRALSQKDVCTALNLHGTALGKWCRGVNRPTYHHAVSLVNFLRDFDKIGALTDGVKLTIDDFEECFDQKSLPKRNKTAKSKRK